MCTLLKKLKEHFEIINLNVKKVRLNIHLDMD